MALQGKFSFLFENSFKTFYFEIIVYLPKSCKDSTEFHLHLAFLNNVLYNHKFIKMKKSVLV